MNAGERSSPLPSRLRSNISTHDRLFGRVLFSLPQSKQSFDSPLSDGAEKISAAVCLAPLVRGAVIRQDD